MFADVPTPARNRRRILMFLALLIGLPMLLSVAVWAGVQHGWWGNAVYTALAVLPPALVPAIFWFNWRIHGIRHRCECGKPVFLFMGMLGQSYCYRCSSCGKLLRLRDWWLSRQRPSANRSSFVFVCQKQSPYRPSSRGYAAVSSQLA
ncbi:MAG: hypothetical protein RBS80_03495 [Thermoguttaceae bacterium]|nr:hypothetical protein [Thermoguttaceae bacterium]